MKKKIGFIDLFIDEWHANNYPAWFRADALGTEFELGLAWEEAPAGGRPLDTWCREMGMTPARSLAQVVEESDALCVLAPSNPEVHERLAELALQSGKPVYVDKPFAPDRAAAERMFRLAEKHGTPLMSCSALRYPGEIAAVQAVGFSGLDVSLAAVRGGGGNFAEYAIHQAEIIVTLMGCGVRRVRRLGEGEGICELVEYAGGRVASLAWHPEFPFGVPMLYGRHGARSLDNLTEFFPNLIHAILGFFQSGQSPIPPSETLEISALTAAAIEAAGNGGAWVEVG